jgi:hypothetical protein
MKVMIMNNLYRDIGFLLEHYVQYYYEIQNLKGPMI